jgi:hypothetical protein
MGFKRHTPSDYLFLTLYSYFIIFLSFILFVILLSQPTFHIFVFMFIKLFNDHLNGWLKFWMKGSGPN